MLTCFLPVSAPASSPTTRVRMRRCANSSRHMTCSKFSTDLATRAPNPCKSRQHSLAVSELAIPHKSDRDRTNVYGQSNNTAFFRTSPQLLYMVDSTIIARGYAPPRYPLPSPPHARTPTAARQDEERPTRSQTRARPFPSQGHPV